MIKHWGQTQPDDKPLGLDTAIREQCGQKQAPYLMTGHDNNGASLTVNPDVFAIANMLVVTPHVFRYVPKCFVFAIANMLVVTPHVFRYVPKWYLSSVCIIGYVGYTGTFVQYVLGYIGSFLQYVLHR